MKLLPLDCTSKCFFSREDLESLRGKGTHGSFVWAISQFYLAYHEVRQCSHHHCSAPPLSSSTAILPALGLNSLIFGIPLFLSRDTTGGSLLVHHVLCSSFAHILLMNCFFQIYSIGDGSAGFGAEGLQFSCIRLADYCPDEARSSYACSACFLCPANQRAFDRSIILLHDPAALVMALDNSLVEEWQRGGVVVGTEGSMKVCIPFPATTRKCCPHS